MIRDLLAIHAPEPPAWFVPDHVYEPTQPTRESCLNTFLLEKANVEYDPFMDDGAPEPDVSQMELQPDDEGPFDAYFLKRLDWYQSAITDYQVEFNRQRYAQWPWAYADMVLDARTERP